MDIFLSFIVQYMATNTPIQGAYIPQYTHMQASLVPVEVCVLACSPSWEYQYSSVFILKNNNLIVKGKKEVVKSYFVISSRKIIRKSSHQAIIPRIPTNKPSSAETILSRNAVDLFNVLHSFCKSETFCFYQYLSSSDNSNSI